MAKRRTRSKPKPGPQLGQVLRGEVVGSALVVLAFLTLLSLLSPNRGDLTGALISGLQVAFGWGVWLLPVLFAALGFWLVLRKISETHVIPGGRVAGLVGLFLVFEGLIHIFAAPAGPAVAPVDGAGGGYTGWMISQALVVALGLPAAVGALLLAGVAALFAISGRTLAELQGALLNAWDWVRGERPAPKDGLQINPQLPLMPREPLWRRLWRELAGHDQMTPLPPSLGRNAPSQQLPPWDPSPRPAIVGEPRGELAERRAGPSAANTPAPAPTTSSAERAPRIIGSGGQTWRLPTLSDVLEDSSELDIQGEDLRQRAQIIEKTLEGFGVPVQVVEANQGPAVTQFGLRPGTIIRRTKKGEEKRVKVRVSQIQGLSNDLALALAASPIRIEAPVPGRDIVGVEVPNVQISMVSLRGVMETEEYRATRAALKIGLGRDVSGQSAVADLTRMPHLLIAGATGSGKSVCVNSIVTTLLLEHTPATLRFLMIDPKRVELTVYNGIPHLLAPVVVDVERTVPLLQWATKEMDRRYKLFSKLGARNIESYNEKVLARGEAVLPYIVIMIDELADLMLSAPEDVERYICRIAQMARATGMHLVIATQRPSVDVVTGLIKANFPARIAFAVTSQVDSRVILDTPGAEQLLGRGDMLFMAPDASKLHRLQGCYVSDRETQRLVQYWKGVHDLNVPPVDPDLAAAGPAAGESDEYVTPQGGPEPPWLPGQETLQQPLWSDMADLQEAAEGQDDMYRQAVEEVRKAGRASVSLLQRRLRIGYSRAARLIEELETNGVIGPDLGGSRGREVLPER